MFTISALKAEMFVSSAEPEKEDLIKVATDIKLTNHRIPRNPGVN